MGKIRVGILYGGKSAEHEVSLQSAKNILDALDREKYEPVLLGIDKAGRWHLREASGGGDSPSLPVPDGGEVVIASGGGGRITGISRTGGDFGVLDLVFPVLHGPFGEDGTVQGLLRLADLPFVGSGVLGSAVGMDKDIMKRLLRDSGVPIGKFITLSWYEKIPSYDAVCGELGRPLFVKPANMGSSVGVNKIHDEQEYHRFIKEAFEYDRKIIIEEFIRGREIECAVLGNEDAKASVPGEIISRHEFYSYDAKYLDEDGAALEIPAKIPEDTAGEIRELALKTFRVLDCAGLARVDFFLREDGTVLVNEINTLPGFTRISMYPKLWEASGIPCGRLVDTLMELALERHRRDAALKTSYA